MFFLSVNLLTNLLLIRPFNTRGLTSGLSSSSEAGVPCVNAHAGTCAGDRRKPAPYRDANEDPVKTTLSDD